VIEDSSDNQQMRKLNLIFSIILLAGCSYLLYETSSFPPSLRPRIPGPDYWPKLILLFLLILSILLLVKNLRKPQKGDEPVQMNHPVVFGVMGMIALFFVLLPFLGYAVTTFILLMALLRTIGMRNIKNLVMIPLSFIIIVYFFFTFIFGVQLPKGTLLWFL
jgi:putative tricarboxylic transport membrane protein